MPILGKEDLSIKSDAKQFAFVTMFPFLKNGFSEFLMQTIHNGLYPLSELYSMVCLRKAIKITPSYHF